MDPHLSIYPTPSHSTNPLALMLSTTMTRNFLFRNSLVFNTTLLHSRRPHSTLPTNTSSNLPKCLSRFPPHALTSNLDFVVEFIDLLQCKTFGFINHEVDEGDAEEAAGEPDEEDFGLEVGIAVTEVDEVGGGVGDCPAGEVSTEE